jgi:spore coat protein JB
LQTEKPNEAGCGTGKGSLPGDCGSLAYPYISMQESNPARYSRTEALQTGTLFPGLNLPFKAAILENMKLPNTALAELMALDFAVDELGLYLTTHPDDQEVLDLYWSYIKLANEGREKYQKLYGPISQTDLTPEDGYAWLKDPWPWDVGGND